MFKDSAIQGRVGLPLRCQRQRSTPQTAGSWMFDPFSKQTQKDIAQLRHCLLKFCSVPLSAVHPKPSMLILKKHALLITLMLVFHKKCQSKAKSEDQNCYPGFGLEET